MARVQRMRSREEIQADVRRFIRDTDRELLRLRVPRPEERVGGVGGARVEMCQSAARRVARCLVRRPSGEGGCQPSMELARKQAIKQIVVQSRFYV